MIHLKKANKGYGKQKTQTIQGPKVKCGVGWGGVGWGWEGGGEGVDD